ncbi:MAG: peptidoglycan/xylan/chitin deacetylase (PgdA/CDA1 family) [Kiritimatiellia bacterium]|jgi:peptidoglycan/xylan/chitin deacetylase (PgdA/CDA1 family)
MYHAVQPSTLPLPNWCFVTESAFREQMHYLKEHFLVVPLASLAEHLAEAESDRPLAAITFDDGYRNNYTCAYPILREFNLPATIFLATDFIDSDRAMWDASLFLALVETTAQELVFRGTRLNLSSIPHKAHAFSHIRTRLKERPLAELSAELHKMRKDLGFSAEGSLALDNAFRMLQTSDVREMAESELISFGGHTAGHCILRRESPEEQTRQILASLEATERMTGTPCTLFAYPNGSLNDYDAVAMNVLRDAGVTVAVNTEEGPCTEQTPLLELQRYGIGQGLDQAGFSLKVHHVMHRLRRGAR